MFYIEDKQDTCNIVPLKGNAAYLKIKILLWMKTMHYPNTKMIPLGHNRTNGAVYYKIYFQVEICSAH